MLSGAGQTPNGRYSASKFIQLLSAHRWRRQLGDKAVVVAVSPGMIPGTGLNRDGVVKWPDNMPDAKSVPEGTSSILVSRFHEEAFDVSFSQSSQMGD